MSAPVPRLALLALLACAVGARAAEPDAEAPFAEAASVRVRAGAAWLNGVSRAQSLSVDYQGLTPSDVAVSARAWPVLDGKLGLAGGLGREGLGLYEGGQRVMSLGLLHGWAGVAGRVVAGAVRFEPVLGWALDQVPGFSGGDAVTAAPWTRQAVLAALRAAVDLGPVQLEVNGALPVALSTTAGSEKATSTGWSAGLGVRWAALRTGPAEWGLMLEGRYASDAVTAPEQRTVRHDAWHAGLALDVRLGNPPGKKVAPPPPPETPTPPPPPEAPPTGSLLVIATDKATGARLPGVVIRAGAEVATTGEDGAARLAGLPPGPVSLTLAHEGYLPGVDAAVVVAGVESEAAIALLPEKQRVPATVQGLVRSAQGGAPIQAALEVPEARLKTKADERGAFLFTLPAGRYTLSIQAAGYRPQTKVLVLKDGEQAIFNLDLTPR